MISISIVGGGYSALICAYELLTQDIMQNINVTIYSDISIIGNGLAYSTDLDCHLLNVPASKMSYCVDKPNDFVDWLLTESIINKDTNINTYFAQRKVYGRYLNIRVQQLLDNHNNLQVFNSNIVKCEQFENKYILSDNENITSDKYDIVIFANGNKPNNLDLIDKHIINNPWGYEHYKQLINLDSVLIIGSGLTMVDSVLALQEIGYKGDIYAISRHGLLPLTHDFSALPYEGFIGEYLINNAKIAIIDLFAIVRQHFAHANYDIAICQKIVDSIRPYTQQIWSSFDLTNQMRFMRHVRHYWDVIRHRIAPEVDKKLYTIFDKNNLYAARILDIRLEHDSLLVDYKLRGGEISTLKCNYIINATGVTTINGNDLLFNQIISDQLFDLHPNGLGFALDNSYGSSRVSNLYAMGPLTKAQIWENIAVPDIRVQAKKLVEIIVNKNIESTLNA